MTNSASATAAAVFKSDSNGLRNLRANAQSSAAASSIDSGIPDDSYSSSDVYPPASELVHNIIDTFVISPTKRVVKTFKSMRAESVAAYKLQEDPTALNNVDIGAFIAAFLAMIVYFIWNNTCLHKVTAQ